MKTLKKNAIASLTELIEEVEALSIVILTSTKKAEITTAFNNLECIVVGRCINDFAESWERDLSQSFNLSRAYLPPKFLQLVKARFYNTKKWDYVKPLYSKLFHTLYMDIHPDTDLMQDTENEMEAPECTYSLPRDVIKRALKEFSEEQKKRVKKIMKKQSPVAL